MPDYPHKPPQLSALAAKAKAKAVKRTPKAFARELHAVALVAIRKHDGYNDGSTLETSSPQTRIGLVAIAKHILAIGLTQPAKRRRTKS